MKKSIIIAVSTIVVGSFLGGSYFAYNYHVESIMERDSKISMYKQSFETTGAPIPVYGLANRVTAGSRILDTDITSINITSDSNLQNYFMDPRELTGSIARIDINPGIVTKDMTTTESVSDSTRYLDIYMPTLPVGLKAGDYIDFRIRMPYGENYVVLSKKRIDNINSNILKLYVDETEINFYTSALIDYFLNEKKGASLWVSVYPEPSMQDEAKITYAIPSNIVAVMNSNPNILNKINSSNMSKRRDVILSALSAVSTDKGNLVNGGIMDMDNNITQGGTDFDNKEKEKELIIKEGVVE